MSVRILIAEPGEAAARVARTCKRIDATAITVVTTEAERGVHVESCDEVVLVRGDALALTPEAIVDAATRSNATHVHPGYASFERLLGLARAFDGHPATLLAPSASALEKALDRAAQRSVAEEVHVRFIPGATAPFEKLADAIEAADAIGYPVRVRMSRSGVAHSRKIDDEDQLFASWDEVHAQAKAAGCGVLVEREIEQARRVDVLVATDAHGESLALAETEIALAKHEIGVDLDESPSPELSVRSDGEAVRLAIFESSARFAQAFGLVGITTVRVFLDADGHFFVAGLRAGLPRHHGTIEMVSNLDLIGVELTLHKGEAIPDEVHSMQPSGHAISASLRDLEGTGSIVKEMRAPPQPQRKVRFDPSVIDGETPATADQGLLLRVTSFAAIRHASVLGLDRMLAEIDIQPVKTNARALRGVLADDAFRAGKYDSSLAERLRYPR